MRAKFQDIVNKMTTLRSSPSPSPSISEYPIIQEIFNQSLTLRGGQPNNTEMAHVINESTIYNLKTIQHIALGVLQLAIAFFLLQLCAMCIVRGAKEAKKQKQENVSVNIPNPFNWIMNKYKQWKFAEVLPTIRPKKAKESPFCGPLQTPPILPSCPRLDGAEKGQNIMFRFRGPTNSRIESEGDTETRITIVAVVENNSKPPLPPRPVVAVQPV